MQLSNSPGKLVLPFAASGNKNAIPVTSQVGITPGAASLADGFPPLTMTPVAAGGVPPSGLDMNGILYALSTVIRWANGGGGYTYDVDFAADSNVGGYAKGARLARTDGFGYWLNTVDNNATDPEAGGAGWVPDFTNGVATVAMSSANVTLTPLQYGLPVIVITGTLTTNLNLIFPTIVGKWAVIDNTTGPYVVTLKTASGLGVVANTAQEIASVDGNIVAIGPQLNVINVRNFGAVGDGVTNDTTSINNAIAKAIASGQVVFVPYSANDYIWDGYTSTGQGIKFSIVGEEGNLPTMRPTQEGVDDGNYMLLLTSTRYSNVSGLALASDVKPNMQKIPLVSVAGLSAGMMIQISSDRLWYNGHRGVYYCGEIHRITDVDSGTNTVTIEDFTRDVYTTSQTLVIRAWNPNRVTIKNLKFRAPYPATTITSVGIALQQCVDAIVDNVHLKGFRNSGILENLCWNSRFSNIHVENDDALDTSIGNGYGIESNGSVGTLVDGIYTKGIRRAWDAGSISGTTEAAVNRDWKVQNFIVRGGGAWYPATAAIGYGIGTHGSSENGVICNGFIEDCSNGITARGRNTTVDSVTFAGTFDSAVSLHENGAGLIVKNCVYDSFNYPNKFADLADIVAGSGCRIFVQLGLTSGGVDANCFYDLPIVIGENVCKGLTSAFIQVGQNTSVAKNLRVTNNHVEALPGVGNTFNTFAAFAANTNLGSSVFFGNEDGVVNGTVVTWSTNFNLAYKEAAVTLEFKIDGNYYATIPENSVIRIPRVSLPGKRVIILGDADTGGRGLFQLIPENATLTNMASTSAGWVATATGSSLTGTTGTPGNVTFGLMNNGDLYIENRSSGVYTFRLTVQ